MDARLAEQVDRGRYVVDCDAVAATIVERLRQRFLARRSAVLIAAQMGARGGSEPKQPDAGPFQDLA